MEGGSPYKLLIRYQEELKEIVQSIQNLIHENDFRNPEMKNLITEQQKLIKYLQTESSSLNPQSKKLYLKNLARYKRKYNQHQQFLIANNAKPAIPNKPYQSIMEYENQNTHLARNKMTMYDNQRIHDNMGGQLQAQGDVIYGGIQRNRDIRREAQQSESSIKLIQIAILKRKLMFISLLVFFVIAVIIVIIAKVNKK